MKAQNPIGIFDSGVGGLTVAKAVLDLLPNENLVYFGDTARYPYGIRPLDEVRGYALQIMEYLVNVHNVKFLIVACNTASAALTHVEREAQTDREAHADREIAPVPLLDVIEPGVSSLVAVSQKGKVGVIGTTGTISSGAYQRAIAAAAPEVEVYPLACPGFVEFVERNEVNSQEVRNLAENLLAPLKEAKIDALLLGCTHYPFLAQTIGAVMGPEVTLVSSADETAFKLKERLQDSNLLSPQKQTLPQREWISTGTQNWFPELGVQLLGEEILGPDMSSFRIHEW